MLKRLTGNMTRFAGEAVCVTPLFRAQRVNSHFNQLGGVCLFVHNITGFMLDVHHTFVTQVICQLTNYFRHLIFKTTIFCVLNLIL